MATYIIRLWNTETNDTLVESTRAARVEADDCAYTLAYETLAAFGKLDTPAAWRVCNALGEWDEYMPMGTHRSLEISNTGRTLTLSRTA